MTVHLFYISFLFCSDEKQFSCQVQSKPKEKKNPIKNTEKEIRK